MTEFVTLLVRGPELAGYPPQLYLLIFTFFDAMTPRSEHVE
jgi:hypothetical protein